MTILTLIFFLAAPTDTSRVKEALLVYRTDAQRYLIELAENKSSSTHAPDTIANTDEARMLKTLEKLFKINYIQLLKSLIITAELAVMEEWKNSPTNDLEEINFRIRKMYKKYLEGDVDASMGMLPDEFYAKARLDVLKIK